MNKTNSRVAIYCRLARKDRHGIERQKLKLCEYAKSLGYTDFTVYIDNGYSGTTLDRPAFSKLNTAMQKGKVDIIIMRDISRIARSYLLAPSWIEQATNQGVTLLAVDGSLQDYLQNDSIQLPHIS